MKVELQKEIHWLLDEKYQGKRTPQAEKDIARLERGEHVDYVIGWVQFLGCKIDLSIKPLIPRPETEFWTAVASRAIKLSSRFTPKGSGASRKILSRSRRLRILDVFAGSGCIGVAVLKHVPETYIDFAEKDKDILEQIALNAELNGVDKSRYTILQSDIFSCTTKKYDYILANPPYVPEKNKEQVQQSVIEQEPYGAVFGGEDGLLYIRKFLSEVKNYLLSEGAVYMEFDPQQKVQVKKMAQASGAKEISMQKDQYGKWRYVRLAF